MLQTNGVTKRKPHTRRPRFKRVPLDTSLDIADSADHIAVLLHLANHRFLKTTHFEKLFPHLDRQRLSTILRELYDAEYIDRPDVQKLWLFLREGDDKKKDFTYAPYNKGVRFLREYAGISKSRSDWKEKNDVREHFVEHTLLVSDILVSLAEACRKPGNPRLIYPHEILQSSDQKVRESAAPKQWKVEVSHDNHLYKRKLIPDGFFGLHFENEPEGRNRAYFFLEADRGTETVYSPNMMKSSIFQKYLKYRETHDQGIHTKRYNIKGFRVLFITTKNETRVESFLEANKKVNGGLGSRLFYFLTYEEFRSAKDPLELEWTNGLGESVRLVD